MKTVEQIRDILEQNGKYVFSDSEESQMYQNYLDNLDDIEVVNLDDIDFIKRAKEVGLPTILDNGIEKVYLNLNEPISLKDDFLFPIEFNHLVYIIDMERVEK